MSTPQGHRRPLEDPLALVPRALTKLSSLWRCWFYPFASVGRKVSFHYTSEVSRARSPRIRLGNAITLMAHTRLNVATEDPTGEPTIILEDHCALCFGTIISARNRVHLERDVLVSQMALIMDHNHSYEDISLPVVAQGISTGGTIRIGQGTWVGHGATILCSRGDLTIGRNCVIAAKSIVTRSIPDYSVVAGNPARIIKYFDLEKKVWLNTRDENSERMAAQSEESA